MFTLNHMDVYPKLVGWNIQNLFERKNVKVVDKGKCLQVTPFGKSHTQSGAPLIIGCYLSLHSYCSVLLYVA